MRTIPATIFVSLILLSSILLGANRPWAWSGLFAVLTAFCALSCLFSARIRSELPRVLGHLAAPLAAFSCVCAWILVQPEVASALQRENATSEHSIDAQKSAVFAIRLTMYALVFVAGVVLATKRRDSGRALLIIAGATTVFAVYAIIAARMNFHIFDSLNTVAGAHKTKAFFVNQNSYVLFAAFGLYVNLTLLQPYISNTIEIMRTRRNRFRAAADLIGGRYVFLLVGVISNLVALAWTGSRAGIFSAVLGLIVLVLLFVLSRRARGAGRLMIVAIPVMILLFAFMTQLADRSFLNSEHDGLRWEIYGQIIVLLSEQPFLGAGLGGFQDAFLPYRTQELSWLTWDYAHNSYLELATELGIPAAMLFYGTIGWLLWQVSLAALRSGFTRSAPNVAIACTTAAAAHAMVDFSLQMPSTAALYALLLGIAWGTGHVQQSRH